jgi:hypothetical protein
VYGAAFGAILILLCAFPVFSQQDATAPVTQQTANASTTPESQPSTTTATTQQLPAGDGAIDGKNVQPGKTTFKNDRIMGLYPNYATVELEDQFGPLSVKEKFKLTEDSMLDPVTFPFIGFVALIGQAQNSEPAYGQGFEGYGKRYATAYADAGIGTLMTTSVFPSLLHDDPRYFQLGKGSIWHRALYSVSRIFVTRTDSGSHQFNTPEIVGNLVAAGISNVYHPEQDRTFGNTMSVWGTDVMWDATANVVKEFWPDLKKKLRKNKNNN